MLAKKFRLTRRQINLVYKKGRGRNFGILGLKYLPNRLGYWRFALVVPNAVLKSVVARNRLRRVMYDEIDRIAKGGGNIDKSGDYIIRLYQKPTDEKVIREKIQEIIKNV